MKRNTYLPTLLSILFIAFAWEVIALKIGFPALFPPLPDLLKETGRLLASKSFFSEIGFTILRGWAGFFIALSIAMLLATIASFSMFWDRFLHPIIVVARSIPVISLVLLALLWFAPPSLPVFIALVTMFPILYQNILTGLKSTDHRYLEMAMVFGKNRMSRFLHISLPSAKTQIYDGIKTAMGFGWRAIIIGEVLAQPLHGIGTAMKQAQAYINVSELIAWTVIAVGISYSFEYLIRLFQGLNVEKSFPHPATGKPSGKQSPTVNSRIKVIDLEKEFGGKAVLESFSIVFHSEKINCIKAPSGKGKTTLLRLLAGLETPNEGKIILPENKRIGYSFQDVRLLPWYTITENIAYVLENTKCNRHEISNLTAYLLEKMELSEHAHKYPHELSGGQQQRAGLARSLAIQPDILLLDEPLNGLDDELKIRIIAFLDEWFTTTRPLVVWATHENIRMKDFTVKEIHIQTALAENDEN